VPQLTTIAARIAAHPSLACKRAKVPTILKDRSPSYSTTKYPLSFRLFVLPHPTDTAMTDVASCG